ncbi:MAG TPA: phosphoribosylanthranilate isomerase [Bacteroidota bacterium]|nr:phosphoribosylanthranilate isomerase [Bacteroidota bacterium]
MFPTDRPRVKICCISSPEEMRLAVRLGASAIGLVSAMPSGPGPIPEEDIARISALVPPGVSSFLLTSRLEVEEIVSQHRKCRTTAIQICDRLPQGEVRRLRQVLPGIRLVQVIHVNGAEAIDEARLIAPSVDGILLDSGDPNGPVKRLGGTGRVHDWKVSRAIREGVDVPVFLAGGLSGENVRRAIEEVGPFAVDVCSGVRTEGRLDEKKLNRFFSEVRAAGLP